jgi:streptomycin 6-kinase
VSVFPVDEATQRRLTLRFGESVRAWFAELPALLTRLESTWAVEFDEPIPRGSVSVVYRCHHPDGRPAVLKVSPDRARLAFEAKALDAWHTEHTPTVLALDEAAGALLIEAIEPGTPLDVAGVYPPLTSVASLLRCLHGTGMPDPLYPVVARRVDYLFDSSAKLYQWQPALIEVVPEELYRRGRALAARLAHEAAPPVLLHGDLTPSNILDGGDARGLVAIDPAPCLGDAAFDAIDLLMWDAGDVATVEDRAVRLAAATDLGADRLIDWCSAFAAMNALELASNGTVSGARIDALIGLASHA